jgi:hypothetical protein
MSHVDKGLGSFSVIDVPAAALLLVGETAIRWKLEAVPGRRRGDHVFHRTGGMRRGRVPTLQRETTGREGLPTAAQRQSAPAVGTWTSTSERLLPEARRCPGGAH